MTPSRAPALLVALALLAAALTAGSAGASGHTVSNHVVESHDGLGIHVTVYRPAGADALDPAPVILHSHGWAGTRTSTAGAFGTELGRGFGVVSIDQRGHGQTGGTTQVQSPEYEGRDIAAVVDFVATLDWVARDVDEEGAPIPDDPVLFAMGGSYGGGYQLVGALTEMRDRADGRTRFNALAPEIAWYDLPESLAPQGVVRSGWVAALYAAGARMFDETVHTAFAYGTATGQWPDGTVPGTPDMNEHFGPNGPSGFVADGILLDIPVLIRQGTVDTLFNFNQGAKTFDRALTPAARDRSIFVAYNGGHTQLPTLMPPGFASGSDACSPGGFTELRLAFFEAVIADESPRDLVGGYPYHMTTAGGACVRTHSLQPSATRGTGYDIQVTSGWMTTTGVGAPHHLELATGPLTVAGIPQVRSRVTTVGVEQRVFFALSVGEDAETARVVQYNMLPLREALPVVQQERTVELPGMAVEVPEGENLYLTVSPISDIFAGHGSVRTPGWVGLENIRVDLPLVE